MADIERLHRIKTLTEDMGVNLAGAEVALKLMNRIEHLESDVQTLTSEVNRLREQNGPANRRRGPNQQV
jgi:MerR family transcriptional regulator/heat shock protein HspR